MENNEDFDYQGKKPDQVEKNNKFIFYRWCSIIIWYFIELYF
jgi:hypothetical protein